MFSGLLLFWEWHRYVETKLQDQSRHMQDSVRAFSNELATSVRRLNRLAMIFAEEQRGLIGEIFHNRENPVPRHELEKKIKAYFPSYHAYTITNEDGEPVLADVEGLVGKACRAALARYSKIMLETPHAYPPAIHFNMAEGGYDRHFDLMAPWFSGAQGIFYVSINAEYIRQMLSRHERVGFDLLLLHRDKHYQVELTSSDGIVSKKIKRNLSKDELDALDFLSPVEGTRWSVAAMPAGSFMDDLRSKSLGNTLMIWLGISIMIILGAMYFSSEQNRHRRLTMLNEELQKSVTAHQAAEERLRQLADHDEMTGLPNKKSAQEFLDRVFASMDQAELRPAVLFFDIDRFKYINESIGHEKGDRLIREVARRIQPLVSQQNLFARWDSNTFVIVVQHARDENELARYADTLLNAMREPISIDNEEIIAALSMGISIYPEAGDTPILLLRNADLAMNRARAEGGRNQARFFLQEMDTVATERMKLERDIRRGLEAGEFVPWYQPRMCLKTGSIVGCEALMRWDHPKKGIVNPATFMPVLEETGLIEKAGDLVRASVCRDRERWQEFHLDPGVVSVNLSGAEFSRQDIIWQLDAEVTGCGLDPEKFEIEITENHLMGNTADNLAKLHALKGMGFSLAIDDFGTGYSSLSYLKRFPVDVIKIDKSFIDNCGVHTEDQDIVRAIISLADSLDMRVVAEGVEYTSQLSFLREAGCDEIQGYLIGKPMRAQDLEHMLTRRNKIATKL